MFYPLVVIAVLLIIISFIIYLLKDKKGELKARLIIAALLPVVGLILVQTTGTQLPIPSHNNWALLAMGALTGVSIIEFARMAIQGPSEAIYILFLSLVGTFIIYLLIQGNGGNTLISFLSNLIMVAGLDVIFLGLPTRVSSSGTRG